ncbi:MAG: histidinol-phosphatase HisJ family protein [Fusobacteriaceae bacterium]
MILSDYHIHSKFSGDSKEDLDEIVKKSIDLGLEEIAITDHHDWNSPQENHGFVLDIEKYFKEIKEIKEKYKKKIEVKIGIELGIQPHICKESEKLIKSKEWDFVLCSLHTVQNFDVSLPEYFIGKNKQEAQNRYFQDVLYSAKNFQEYSVMSHLDFISRYGGEEFKGFNYSDHYEIIDLILKTIIEKNKGIEINTSGFRYGENRTYPNFEIVKRYFQLGGEIVTVGSDSHRKEDISKDFKKVYDFLKSINVKYISSFNIRENSFRKI